MSTSTTPTKSTGLEVSTAEKKKLLHDKEGSIFPRDLTGTKNVPLLNVTKIISWNVAGLRGTLKKNPKVLDELVDKENPDILCLQETKLQNIGDLGDLLVNRGYSSYWTYSEVKKGYAGTAIFIRELKDPLKINKFADGKNKPEEKPPKVTKKQAKLSAFFVSTSSESAAAATAEVSEEVVKDVIIPHSSAGITLENVSFHLPDVRFNGEGRWVEIETPDFYFINTYVPNSGQNLERLDYRVDEWDPYVIQYLNDLRAKKSVIFSGDLNVAHLDLDVYNAGAKHLLKQAGTTLREKNSFGNLLATGFKDALRHLYPDSRGQFTYWSTRTSGKPYNKGLRLDYFVCSDDMFPIEVEGESEDKNELKNEAIELEKTEESKEVESSSSIKGSKKRKATIEETASSTTIEVENTQAVDETPIPRIIPNISTMTVIDSYTLHDANDCSDHCPVVLLLSHN
eukprot:CAMPEP_0119040228 /NCGR_PEP_ID=MMETSP1177-20130426/10089_1 /TAXON_ID=2985 /ORGANISM="Ochromonas sp, Strain CCMP1899" /LENGTH=454 /DNA_ID=CAMNT_0007005071 /DNA_START=4373 /DNA_END=5737 /DNA_ORIENTATION=-